MVELAPIRVMLVDDQAVVRRGLRLLLQVFDDLTLVGEAADGVEAVRLCAKLQPDVVLMDLIMPEMDGVMATRIIHHRYPEVQIIVLSSFKDESMVQAALQAGAVSHLSKTVTIDEIAAAIREAGNNKSKGIS